MAYTTTKYSIPQGRLFIAPRNASGVNGALIQIGDSDSAQITFNPTTIDIDESMSGNHITVAHAVQKTVGGVKMNIKNFDADNLVRALYGSQSVLSASAVVDAPFTVWKGDTIGIAPNSTGVVVKKAATPLVLGTDYTYEAQSGLVQFISTSAAVAAVDGAAGVAVTVSYTPAGARTRVDVLTQVMKDYKIVFEEINTVNGQTEVKRHVLPRVALDITASIELISASVNMLPVTGRILPAPEIAATTSLSNLYYIEL